MKNDLAQLFISGVGIALAICVIGICLCGLYAMGSLAWDLWGRHLLPARRSPRSPAPRLVDAEALGWWDDFDWTWRGTEREASVEAPTGEEPLPRVEAVA